MKHNIFLSLFFLLFIFKLFNSTLIEFNTKVTDCSVEICNFNNDTLWIGEIAPGVNDTALIDFSDFTTTQTLFIPTNYTATVENLNLVGATAVLNVTGALVIGNSVNLTLSSLNINTLKSEGDTVESFLQYVNLDDASISLNTDLTHYYINLNGSGLSSLTIIQGTFEVPNEDNSTLFQLGSLLTEEGTSLFVIADVITVLNVQVYGALEVFGGVDLTFGPSKRGYMTINAFTASLGSPSSFLFNDDVKFNQITVNQLLDTAYADMTFEGTVQIYGSSGLNNTVLTISEDSILMENITLNLSGTGGIIFEGGQAELSDDITVGSAGINLKPGSFLYTGAMTITGTLDIHNATLNSNSTIIQGDFLQDSGTINFINEIAVNGSFTQTSSDSMFTFTNVDIDPTIPTLHISGNASFMGNLIVTIKDDTTSQFSILLITAGRILSNFSNYQILTYDTNETPTYQIYQLTNSETNLQELWLNCSLTNNTNSKHKLPGWQLALIIVGSISSIFLLFLSIILIYRFIKNRKRNDYVPL